MKSLRFYHGAALCLSLLWAPAVSATESASAQSQWTMAGDGGITWEVKPGNTHQDQIEMSGRKVSAIISYGVRENGSLTVVRQIVFPTLRTVPNDTHASLSYTFGEDAMPRVFIGVRPAREVVARIHLRGLAIIESTMGSIALTRTLFPSADNRLYPEKYVFANRGTREVTFSEENGGGAFSVLYNAYIDDSADRNRERLVICGAIIGGKAVWNGKTKLCNLESQRMR